MKKSVAMLLLAFSGIAVAADGSADSIARGQEIYGKKCSKCHGEKADGQGRDAYKYHPAPTNFRGAGAARAYMVDMTKKGGKAMARSEDMPEWGDDLTEAQIQDVVNYIMSVRINK